MLKPHFLNSAHDIGENIFDIICLELINMRKNLTLDMHYRLGEYFEKFVKLRNVEKYPGSIKLIEDYESIKEGEGDEFFSKYGVGNDIFTIDKPFERAIAYESLLYLLYKYDDQQYFKIHKGTPYFFIGWTSFQYYDFEKALFYLDAAASEDIRRIRITNASLDTQTPAIDFMLLNAQSKSVGILLNAQIGWAIANAIKEFNAKSGLNLELKNFIESFIKPLLFGEDRKQRSILTALYAFFLEVGKYQLLVELRSSEGGSLDPLLNHLFKGARILESLTQAGGGKGNSLEKKVKSLNKLNINTKLFKGNRKLNSALINYKLLKGKSESFQDYNFAVSNIIRNTTGHSLLWSDEFKELESYEILHKSLVNSIFWVIFKLWVE